MAEKLTTYDPAENLTSDAGIDIFMARAFGSEDASISPTLWHSSPR